MNRSNLKLALGKTLETGSTFGRIKETFAVTEFTNRIVVTVLLPVLDLILMTSIGFITLFFSTVSPDQIELGRTL